MLSGCWPVKVKTTSSRPIFIVWTVWGNCHLCGIDQIRLLSWSLFNMLSIEKLRESLFSDQIHMRWLELTFQISTIESLNKSFLFSLSSVCVCVIWILYMLWVYLHICIFFWRTPVILFEFSFVHYLLFLSSTNHTPPSILLQLWLAPTQALCCHRSRPHNHKVEYWRRSCGPLGD